MELNGKRMLVLGLGESGLAMARWGARCGARVRVADSRPVPPFLADLRQHVPTAEFHCDSFNEKTDKGLLSGVDLLALSPGLSGGAMLVLHARAQGIPVIGEIELFAWALRDLGLRGAGPAAARVIAITGTNGKTTTTALTAHLCNSIGMSAKAAGNISPAALNALRECLDEDRLPQVWVLELSSFQLETLSTLAADAATVLNVTDDHLDRYADLDEYASAKARIFEGSGVQVLNRQDGRVRKMARPGHRLITFGLDAPGEPADFGLRENRGEPWIVQGDRFLLPVSDLAISGLHNAANAMAALALVAGIGVDPGKLLPGLRSFRGLPHRVERVADARGVVWYDDSKGTNVGATVAALEGLRQPVVLIVGGDGKGQDFTPLSAAVRRYARAVVLIGRDGPAIGAVLDGTGIPCHTARDMEDAVRLADGLAQPGDAVLLSPACASFDMFRNYEHRAQVFIAAVQARLGAIP